MAGEELKKNSPGPKPAKTFLFNAVLMNVRFKSVLTCRSFTYTTKQILDIVKAQDYASEFKGFGALGKNMVFPVDEQFDRNKNLNLVKMSNNINLDFPYKFKIVTRGYEEVQKLNALLKEQGYTKLEVVPLDAALPELLELHNKLKTL